MTRWGDGGKGRGPGEEVVLLLKLSLRVGAFHTHDYSWEFTAGQEAEF